MKNIFQEIKDLEKVLKTYNNPSVEELDELINKTKELTKEIDYPLELYNYCKEYYPNLIEACKVFKSRVKKKDNQVCIEGETGSGKSTLTLCIFTIMCYILKKKLNLEKNVLYIPKENELSSKLRSLKDNELLWVDESIKSLYKGKWQNKDAMDSNETIQTERFRHNSVFYCIPSFNELTKSFRNVNLKFRIWAMSIDPPIAILKAKEKDPDLTEKFGAWHIEERAKLKRKVGITPLSTPEEYLRVERKLAGYCMDFAWVDLESHESFCGLHFLYELYKKKSRAVMREQEIPEDEQAKTKNQNKHKEMVINFMEVGFLSGIKTVKEWAKTYSKDGVVTDRTLRSYWAQMLKKVEEGKGNKVSVVSKPYYTLNPIRQSTPQKKESLT